MSEKTEDVRPVSKGKLLQLARDGRLVLVERTVVRDGDNLVEVSRVERLVVLLASDEEKTEPGVFALTRHHFLSRTSWARESGDGLITLYVNARLTYVFRVQS